MTIPHNEAQTRQQIIDKRLLQSLFFLGGYYLGFLFGAIIGSDAGLIIGFILVAGAFVFGGIIVGGISGNWLQGLFKPPFMETKSIIETKATSIIVNIFKETRASFVEYNQQTENQLLEFLNKDFKNHYDAYNEEIMEIKNMQIQEEKILLKEINTVTQEITELDNRKIDLISLSSQF